jgi:hypothetical protein
MCPDTFVVSSTWSKRRNELEVLLKRQWLINPKRVLAKWTGTQDPVTSCTINLYRISFGTSFRNIILIISTCQYLRSALFCQYLAFCLPMSPDPSLWLISCCYPSQVVFTADANAVSPWATILTCLSKQQPHCRRHVSGLHQSMQSLQPRKKKKQSPMEYIKIYATRKFFLIRVQLKHVALHVMSI